MGIPQIWELIKNAQPVPVPRYPIANILPEKRVAIDGYHVLFECGFITKDGSAQYNKKPILNLIHRLKELIALDSWFILIFDGNNKPSKVRRCPTKDGGQGNISPSRYEGIKHGSIGTYTYVEEVTDSVMYTVEVILKLFKVSHCLTNGEGEVYCCFLQNENKKVDYVWSNDSDCFIYGGTKILKNYSKSIEDVGVTSSKNVTKQKESLITLVDYDKLVSKYGMLNREQLLLFTVLFGGDYHFGVKGLGKEKCIKLVQLKIPNFTKKFYGIFEDIVLNFDANKELEYGEFQTELFKYCQDNSSALFGRDYSKSLLSSDKKSFENWPESHIIKHYFHPGNSGSLTDDLLTKDYANIKGSKIYDEIDFTEMKRQLISYELPNISNFDKWFHDTIHEMFLVKYILYEYKEDECERIRENVKITEEKDVYIDNNVNMKVSYWKVRFNSFLPNVKYVSTGKSRTPSPVKDSPKKSPSKRQIDILQYANGIWIHKNCVPESHILVQDYRERQRKDKEEETLSKKTKQRRVSPKKRFSQYQQENNLESFLMQHTSSVHKGVQSLNQMKSMENLDNIKKKLFVEEEVQSDSKEQTIDDSEDSLVILEEREVTSGNSNISPGKRSRDIINIFEKPELGVNKIPICKKHRSFDFTKTIDTFFTVDLREKTTPIKKIVGPTPSKSTTLTKVPYLSRTDTFGNNINGSILDRLTSEVEKVVKKYENSDSDSDTTTTTIDSDTSIHNNTDNYSDSDNIFFQL